jgi:hypothetical protein
MVIPVAHLSNMVIACVMTVINDLSSITIKDMIKKRRLFSGLLSLNGISMVLLKLIACE